MRHRIPEHFITDLVNRANIVDIVSRKVSLKRSGDNFLGLCPFHEEKTGSFSVSQSKQIFKCFGCQQGGDVLKFLMLTNNINYPDAIRELAKEYNIEIPYEKINDVEINRKTNLLDILNIAADFYNNNLETSPYKNNIKEYLQRRKLLVRTIEEFNLGFAPPNWDGLISHFKHQNLDSLEKTGLIKQEKSKLYDIFRNRLIFPIRNFKGQTIAFGGRAIDDSMPKYLNSPETEFFKKSETLYGIYEISKLKKIDFVLVVEGYMDVVSLSQAGIKNVVATLGTSINSKHVEILLRFSKKTVFCFDGDKAGKSAAWRAVSALMPILKTGLVFDFLFLDENDDPDSLIQDKGAKFFSNLISTQAVSLVNYVFKHLSEIYNLNDVNQKAEFILQVKDVFVPLKDNTLKSLMFEEIGDFAQIHPDKFSTNTKKFKQQKTNNLQRINKPMKLIDRAIEMLFFNPELINYECNVKPNIKKNGNDEEFFMKLIEVIQQNDIKTYAGVLGMFYGEQEYKKLSLLLNKRYIKEENIISCWQELLVELNKQIN